MRAPCPGRRSRRPARRHLAAIALATVAACGEGPIPPAPAAPALALTPAGAPAAAKAERGGGYRSPVKGSFAGTVNSIRESTMPLVYRLEVEADGNMSHLGRTHAAWVVPRVAFDPTSGRLTVLSGRWHGTLTAANGDRLVGDYTFRSATIPFDATGAFTAIADLVITGGTGRLANAAGEATGLVRGNVLTERFTVELDGRATLVAPR